MSENKTGVLLINLGSPKELTKKSVRKYAISYWRNAVSVRSQSHRLVAQIKNGEIINKELYNLKAKLSTTTQSESNNSKLEKELIKAIPKLNLN